MQERFQFSETNYRQAVKRLQELQANLNPQKLTERRAIQSIELLVKILEKQTKPKFFYTYKQYIDELVEFFHSNHDKLSTQQERWFAGFAVTFYFLAKERSRDLFERLSNAEFSALESLITDFVTSAPQSEKEARIKLLQFLFNNSPGEINRGLDGLKDVAKTQHNYAQALEHPALREIFHIVMKHPVDFRFECTFLANLLGDKEKREFKNLIKPIKTRAPITTTLGNGGWVVCESGEERILQSFHEGLAQIIVDEDGQPLMIIKHFKKFTALTIQPFIAADGTVIPQGTWLSPTTESLREAMRESVDRGEAHFILKERGNWAIMRGIREKNLEDEGAKVVTQTEVIRPKAGDFWKLLEKYAADLDQQSPVQLSAEEIQKRKTKREKANEDG